MSDNVITGLFGKKPKTPVRPKSGRGAVSIVMNGQTLFTQQPTRKDVDFFQHIAGARHKWVTEGRPQSCQQMQ